jgi:two-component system chemotaxis response regulator CheB
MRKVLIVDDSETARVALRVALEADPEILVVGEAENGEQALSAIRRTGPDLVTMDLFLRRENGLDVTRSIMRQCARPILLVTSADTRSPELIYQAMDSGVLEVSAKLPAPHHPDYEQRRRRLQRLVKTLSRVPVVRRHSRPGRAESVTEGPAPGRVAAVSRPPAVQCIVVGASTGGPPALHAVLSELPHPFPLPIVVVQHLANGFVIGFAQWLQSSTGHEVQVVSEQTELEAGKVYLPADDRHLTFSSARTLSPSDADPVNHNRPSVDVLFESTALSLGNRAAAVIMTGMGRDGTQGMKALAGRGCLTIAQEPSSCVVDSMPRSAIEARCVSHVLGLSGISQKLASLA